MSFFSDLSDLITGGLSPEEAKTVRRAGFLVLWRIGFVFFVAFSMGWLAFIGIAGFARAGEIDQKLAPLNASITSLTAAVQAQADAAKDQTVTLLRAAIVEAQVKKCHAPKEETKAIYRLQVVEAQSRYFKLTGQYYPEPACADL